MNRKYFNLVMAVLGAIGVSLWYTPLKVLSIIWLWVLIGLPRQLAAQRI